MADLNAEVIAIALTAKERFVLLRMSDGSFVDSIATVAADANVPLSETRKIYKRFREAGLATYSPFYNEDEYLFQGSGTWLTELGLQVQEIVRGSNDD